MTPSTQITPFWHRLRAISKYPLRGAALWTLLALTAARGLTMVLPLGITVFIFNFLLWAAVYAYAVAILRSTANGHLDPPEVAMEGQADGRKQLWLQVVFVILMLVGAAVGAMLGGQVGAILAFALLALAMPAATLSLAIDDNFWHALDPSTWWAIASRLGWPYLAMSMLSGVILISQANAQDMLHSVLPEVLALWAGYFVATYAVFMYFHLLGYVIYQYHEDLGYQIDRPIARRDANADPDQGLLDEAAEMVLNGDAAGAEDMIGRHLRARGGSAAVHGQYRKLLRLRGDVEASTRHGREYLSVLMAQGNEKGALELARDCLAQDPDFTLAQPEFVAPLARRAEATAQPRVAVQLLSGFGERHFGHADVAPNALMVAKLLAERLGDEARAREELMAVRDQLGTDELRQVQAYLEFLDKLSAPVARA
jgi:hypothetical protein